MLRLYSDGGQEEEYYDAVSFKISSPKIKRGFRLIIDVAKAYDRLEWNYIEFILQKFGFPYIWIQRVMKYVKTVSYSFLRNGKVFGDVKPQRGSYLSVPLYSLCRRFVWDYS